MWARRIGAPPGLPSRVKVIFFSFTSGTLGISIYMYMAGSNVSYLDLDTPASENLLCLENWPVRPHAISWSQPQDWGAFLVPGTGLQPPDHVEKCIVPSLDGQKCRQLVVPVDQLKRPLAIAMGDSATRYDVLGLWARFFLIITFAIWLGVTTHDLALIGRDHKHFILDVTGVNEHCPCIRRVWRSLAGHRILTRLLWHDRVGVRILGVAIGVAFGPAAIVWNLAVFNFVIVPLLLLLFVRYPIRMSRAWVFIVCLACSLYGLALTAQQVAFVFRVDLRPKYALTWQPDPAKVSNVTAGSQCICGCDYAVSFSVCVNLSIIGGMTTLKSLFLALRCLKGLRRSQWANLLSVMFPVPMTVYSVDWRLPTGQPIKFRTEGMPVQGEVAFDPFAMMDEQLDSAFTTVHLKPEPVHRYARNQSGQLNLLPPTRDMEMPGMPKFCVDGLEVRKVEYIGCCGFPWPTGGKQCVYADAIMAQLEEEVQSSTTPDGVSSGSSTPRSSRIRPPAGALEMEDSPTAGLQKVQRAPTWPAAPLGAAAAAAGATLGAGAAEALRSKSCLLDVGGSPPTSAGVPPTVEVAPPRLPLDDLLAASVPPGKPAGDGRPPIRWSGSWEDAEAGWGTRIAL